VLWEVARKSSLRPLRIAAAPLGSIAALRPNSSAGSSPSPRRPPGWWDVGRAQSSIAARRTAIRRFGSAIRQVVCRSRSSGMCWARRSMTRSPDSRTAGTGWVVGRLSAAKCLRALATPTVVLDDPPVLVIALVIASPTKSQSASIRFSRRVCFWIEFGRWRWSFWCLESVSY